MCFLNLTFYNLVEPLRMYKIYGKNKLYFCTSIHDILLVILLRFLNYYVLKIFYLALLKRFYIIFNS